MHSNVISNWKGFRKGLGLSNTETLSTCTFAIVEVLTQLANVFKTKFPGKYFSSRRVPRFSKK